MSTMMIGVIGIVVMLVLLLLKVPVGAAMAVVGFAGFVYLSDINGALGVLATSPFSTMASYSMSVVPLFVLMGMFVFYAGITRQVFSAAYSWLGRLPGGLAIATIGGCAAFAAVCGSSVATSATMCTVALPEMKRCNYDSALATGTLAAGGTIGILIPPSLNFVVYGIVAEQSIGKLFLGGIIPGIIQSILFMATIYILCRRNPLLGPAGPSTSWSNKLSSLRYVWPVLALFLLVMGGIYGGIFTPTEAAAVGAFGAFLLIVGNRMLNRQTLTDSLLATGQTTAMVMFIMVGAMIFNYFLAITKIPIEMARLASALAIDRYLILAVIMFVFIALGCVMDVLAMIMLVVPLILPVITALGFDPIWFGVVLCVICEMGLITPPVGLNVYVIAGMAKDVPMFTVFRGIMPFLYADVVLLCILTVFPQVAMLLPDLMMGK
jgi:C4-dicarboxylate transporter DctM subunit